MNIAGDETVMYGVAYEGFCVRWLHQDKCPKKNARGDCSKSNTNHDPPSLPLQGETPPVDVRLPEG